MTDKYNSILPRLLNPFRKGNGAVVLFGRTYYTWKTPEEVPATIRREEEIHKLQQKEDGWRFYFWWIRDFIWRGYRRIPYEEEAKARAVEKE